MLEVSAFKPGNITPRHDFADTSYEDMLRSAIAVGPVFAGAGERGVGETVLAAVEATRRVAGTNTNLGIALLLAPLAKAALGDGELRARLGATLRALDVADARAAYAAIRLASAGGLRERVEHDVRSEPDIGLRDAMTSAAERDSIASEYVTDFALTFETGVPALVAALGDGLAVRDAIVELHLKLLDQAPDTLIARKRGAAAAATRVGGRARRARGRRRAHRRGPPGAAELRRLAARAGQRAQPRHDRRPRDRGGVRGASRGYALTPSHHVTHSS